jgi:maltooligosyltrehalose trehalohydrolase
VRCGRREEFARFNWCGDIPDPQAETTFFSAKLNWELKDSGRHRTLWLFYQELLRLRRDIPSLARRDKNTLKPAFLPDEKFLVVERWDDASSRVFVAFHFSAEPTELTIPISQGRWSKKLDSSEEQWGGKGSQTPTTIESHGEVHLVTGPWTFLVFEQVVKKNK